MSEVLLAAFLALLIGLDIWSWFGHRISEWLMWRKVKR